MARKDIINIDGTLNYDTIGGFKDRLDGHDADLADMTSKLDGFISLDEYPIQTPETDDTGRFNRALSAALSAKKALLLPPTTINLSSKITVDPTMVIIGAGINQTIINTTASDVGVAWQYTRGYFQEGGMLSSFTLNNSGSSQTNVGLQLSNVFKGVLRYVNVTNFGINIQLYNINGGWTEGTLMDNVHVSGAYQSELEFNQGTGTDSFAYTNIKRIFINVSRNNVNGIHVSSGSVVYNSYLEAAIWLATNLTTAYYLFNEGTIRTCELNLVGEVPGSGTTQAYVNNTGLMYYNSGNLSLNSYPTYMGYYPRQNNNRFLIKNGSAQLYKIGTLPPDGVNTYDQIEVELKGGGWESMQKGYDTWILGSRNGFYAIWRRFQAQTYGTIQVYQEADNSFSVYLSLAAYSAMTVTVEGMGQDGQTNQSTNAGFMYGFNNVTGNTPTGTKVYDSSTATPTGRGINVAVNSGASTLAVNFPHWEPDTNFGISVSPAWNTTYWITNKATSGFTINFGTAPTSASTLDWTIIR